MELTPVEAVMFKDAIVEYWHNNMKHSKNAKFKLMYEHMMNDLKTNMNHNGCFTIKINKLR